jgi:monovalent cation:H+ antiporter-2, CPA2 family
VFDFDRSGCVALDEESMELPFVKDLLVMCGLALAVAFVCRIASIPTIVGFLLTGILAGPGSLALVGTAVDVHELAETGLICLLFSIGLEFSLKRLMEIRVLALVGGMFQVAATIAVGALLAAVWGLPANQSLFLGFLLALSSTAIVLKLLQDKAATESPHGRLSVGILIFQDIVVVPLMLLIPILAGTGGSVTVALPLLAVKAGAVFLGVFVATRWVVPQALYQVARQRSPELFLLGIVVVALSVTWLTSIMGLSPALGAFLAGLIVSESEYSHQALGNVLPFRDLFTSFFFVSIGMLVDLAFVRDHAVVLVAAAGGVTVLKFFTAGMSAMVLGLPLRTAVLAGLALSQVGEFAFVLAESGARLGLVVPGVYQFFLGISVMTMMATPFLLAGADGIARMALRLPLPERIRTGVDSGESGVEPEGLRNHAIIVGFGITGRNLNQAASAAGIPRVIIELNPITVRKEQTRGLPIFFGDASQEPVLDHAGIKHARVLVIVISDPSAVTRIIDRARALNPKLHIIARTRFASEMEYLFQVGATEVISEDYETSLEVLARVLTRYLVPRDEIERVVAQVRADHYRVLRNSVHDAATVSDLELHLSDVEISSLRVAAGAVAVGYSLAGLDMRKAYGISVVGIRRDADLIANPSGDEEIRERDVLLILGAPERIVEASHLFCREPLGRVPQ